MNEAEVVDQLVNLTDLLLAGISVFFTVISAYVAALNYFIGGASFLARLMAFLFVNFVLGLLGVVMYGAQHVQDGLIARLHEINTQGGLSAAGRAVLANSAQQDAGFVNVDTMVRYGAWGVMVAVLLVLIYLTFLHRWKPDVIPVAFASPEQN